MSERDQTPLQVPPLGSASQDEPVRNIVLKQQELAKKQQPQGSWLTSLVLIVLVAGVAVIGYYGVELQKQQLALTEQLAESNKHIVALEQQLADAQQQAQQAGEQLEQRLAGQRQQMDEQFNRYETSLSEMGKKAEREQQAQLAQVKSEFESLQQSLQDAAQDAAAERGFMTEQQKIALDGLEQRLSEIDQLRQSITDAQIALDKLSGDQQEGAQQLAALGKELASIEGKTQSARAALGKQISEQQRAQERYQASQHESFKKLTDQVQSLVKRNTGPDPELIRSVENVSQDIAAINGFRRQVNRDLLKLKERVNRIQALLQ